MRNTLVLVMMAMVAGLWAGCGGGAETVPRGAGEAYRDTLAQAQARGEAEEAAARVAAEAEGQEVEVDAEWQPLFDGETLAGWEVTQFGGEGEVTVENEAIILSFGSPITGVTWEDEAALPRTNYEVALQAMRVDGTDFFCALTFPVGDEYCSFIVGGWGGTVVGLSSIDGFDASENETTTLMSFDTGEWYDVRVRVEPERIRAWIDDEQVVDQNIEGRSVHTRSELDRSQPLGIASFDTTAALRHIRIRELD